MESAGPNTHFGSGTSPGDQADAGERRISQRGVPFELMNDLMSGGLHRSGKAS